MSRNEWREILEQLSNDELIAIVNNSANEPVDKVNAAIKELGGRGFDTANFYAIAQNKRVEEAMKTEDLPELYSNRVIYVFSILFSVIFGGILLAVNFNTANKKNGITPVIVFSVIYTIFTVYVLSKIHAGTFGTFLLAVIGAVILNTVFWNQYLGKDFLYKKKSYVKPLIIALSIFIPLLALFIWAAIVTGQR